MNKTKLIEILSRKWILFAFICLLFLNLSAQSGEALSKGALKITGYEYTVHYDEQKYDVYDDLNLKPLEYQVPTLADGKYLYLQARGGDGGDADHASPDGGEGALITICVKIGDGVNEIPKNSLIRFIIGGKGSSRKNHGGGGGGTGIAVKPPGSNDWEILAVAGGGGGAGGDSGQPGSDYDAKGKYSGQNGEGGTHKKEDGDWPGAGGGVNSGADVKGGGGAGIQDGKFVGGAGGHILRDSGKSRWARGGFGFGGGGGGQGSQTYGGGGGGGGGYSGGAPGDSRNNDGGKGGGSYINGSYDYKYSKRTQNGTTIDPIHGYVKYQFLTDPQITIKHFSFLDNYKLAVRGSSRNDLYFTEKVEGAFGVTVPKIKIPADALSSALLLPNMNIHLTFIDEKAPSKIFHESYFAYFMKNGNGMVVSEEAVVAKPMDDGTNKWEARIKYFTNSELDFNLYRKVIVGSDWLYVPIPQNEIEIEIENGNLIFSSLDSGQQYKVEIAFNEDSSNIRKTLTFSTK